MGHLVGAIIKWDYLHRIIRLFEWGATIGRGGTATSFGGMLAVCVCLGGGGVDSWGLKVRNGMTHEKGG